MKLCLFDVCLQLPLLQEESSAIVPHRSGAWQGNKKRTRSIGAPSTSVALTELRGETYEQQRRATVRDSRPRRTACRERRVSEELDPGGTVRCDALYR